MMQTSTSRIPLQTSSISCQVQQMAPSVADVENHKFNGALYNALMREDDETVKKLCQEKKDGALHILTVHDDTVLHMATYSRQADLVLALLEELRPQHLNKMTCQNHSGNTILHEAATSNSALAVAEKLLCKAPGLLGMRNHRGETALFRAARYGKKEVFEFLAEKISGYSEASKHGFLQRNDKTTILHIAILALQFDLALNIAKKYEHLVAVKDGDGMTALQLLSCNSSAFEHNINGVGFANNFIKSVELWCSSTAGKAVEKEKELRYKSVLELTDFLIERDTSWEATNPGVDTSKPKTHKYGVGSYADKGGGAGAKPTTISSSARISDGEEGETALFLATKSGCVEIVKRILKLYPQAIEHVDEKGRNILHIAIKYRQLEILKLVRGMEVPMKRLVRKIDNEGNSILHTVGIARRDYVPEKIEGPALQLQGELLWFQRVKKVILPSFMNHLNHNNQTAEAVFATTNMELRNLAKEWLRNTAEGCSFVAVLIATVAFAAAYTVPGGVDEQTGYPVLINNPFFIMFSVTDVLSLTSALTAVVIFLSILTSTFQIQNFRRSLPNKVTMGLTFLFLSVSMMMVAFAATIILMIRNKERWTKIFLYALSFLPVGIFALSYFPLYMALSKTYKYLLKKVVIPRWKRVVVVFENYCKCLKIFQVGSSAKHTTQSDQRNNSIRPRTSAFPV